MCLIWAMSIKILFMQRTWTWFMPGLSVGFTSVAFFYLAILLYNSKAVFESIWTANYYAAFEHQLASPVSWLIVVLVSGIVVMVEMCLQMWRPEAPTATELLVAYEHGLGPKHPDGRTMKLQLRSEAQKDDDDDDDDDDDTNTTLTSVSFTLPKQSINMFSGFMSRWSTPLECMKEMPRKTSRTIRFINFSSLNGIKPLFVPEHIIKSSVTSPMCPNSKMT